MRPANFHRAAFSVKSDEELLRTVEHGIVFSPMHAWRGELSDGEMEDVVAIFASLAAVTETRRKRRGPAVAHEGPASRGLLLR